MSKFSPINILLFCVWYLFVYFQHLHLDNFRGANKTFHFLLSVFVLLGWFTGFVFLIYYGYTIAWWTSIVLFLIVPILMPLRVLIKNDAVLAILSMLGLLASPILAYLMFITIPAH